MRSLLLAALAATSFLASASPFFDSDSQKPLVNQPGGPPRRKLHGRFLHITDIHPDPFYLRNSSASKDRECHSGKGRSGLYGAERSDCDSPFALANATFEWIKENLKDEIDFVVWTGDSARHDNDIEHPRSESQIYDLNRMVVDMVYDTFKKPNPDGDEDPTNDLLVPVVPSIGNNDILPHNIMLPGPSSVTRTYLNIWRHFVPEAQQHVFEHGAYFWTEVIPGKLAVFSLNTMYFFSSNAAVDGCDSPDEPGFQQFTWLKIQLDLMRMRKMKAMLIGHVPPARTETKQAWDDTCWSKYVIWLWNYRDVVVGNIYGHMNLDHFMLLDSQLAEKMSNQPGLMSKRDDVSTWEELVNIQAAGPYLSELRAVLSKIPEPPEEDSKKKNKKGKKKEETGFKKNKKKKGKKGKGGKGKKGKKPKDPKKEHKKYIDKIGGKFAERYVQVFVGPSVVPNYYPSLRVFEYNITGLVDDEGYLLDGYAAAASIPAQWQDLEIDTNVKPKPKPRPDPNVPSPPPTGSAPGPAYSPQSLSFTGYKQLYANLTRLNGWVPKEKDEDEDSFYTSGGDRDKKGGKGDDDDKKKKKPKKPKQAPLPFEFEVEYETYNDTKGYKMKDMSVRSFVKLADGMRDLDVKSKKFDIEWEDSGYPEGDDDKEEGESEEDGSSDEESDEGDEDGEEQVNKKKDGGKDKKKKKGKKKHKHGKTKAQKKKDKLWHLFVNRAFVGSVDGEDVDDVD